MSDAPPALSAASNVYVALENVEVTDASERPPAVHPVAVTSFVEVHCATLYAVFADATVWSGVPVLPYRATLIVSLSKSILAPLSDSSLKLL